VKVRVKEDVTVAVGVEGVSKEGAYTFETKDRSFKAGQHEVTDTNRAALEQLVEMGFAEEVKSATKEE
jgi:uncharacterized UBP type Zn finger protein